MKHSQSLKLSDICTTRQTAALAAARQALENTRERMPARPEQNGASSTYVNTRSSTQQSR